MAGGSSRSGEGKGASGEGTSRRYCAFWLGGQCFGVPIDLVGELVAVESMLPVPLAPPAVVGLFNLRGTPVALVDLAVLLELPAGARDERRALLALVLRTNDLLASVLIDRMESVFTSDAKLTRPDDMDEATSPIEGFLEIDAAGGMTVQVLAQGKLLERLRAMRFRSWAVDDALPSV
jgi:chemotaxis signal transduction protein